MSNPTSPNRPESSRRLRALRVASLLCVSFGGLLFSAGVVGSGEVPVTGAMLRDANRVGLADSVVTPARRGVGPQIPNRQMLVPVFGTNSFTSTGLSSDVVGRYPRAGSLLPEDRLVRGPMGPTIPIGLALTGTNTRHLGFIGFGFGFFGLALVVGSRERRRA